MNKVISFVGCASLLLGLVGCGNIPLTQQTETPKVAESNSDSTKSIETEITTAPVERNNTSLTPSAIRTEVPWSDYDPGTQAEIDSMTISGDCLGIKSYFGMATATEESVKARTGHGNEALTKYLNESLALAQCN